MKYLLVPIIVFLFVFSQTGCHRPAGQVAVLQKSKDSLSAVAADSLIRNDPWLRYSYLERQGKSLFDLYCAVCHGLSGEGDGFNAYNLNPKPHSLADSTYMKALSIETLTETISFGGKGVNKSVLMPGYHNTLDKTQISNVVAYIETFNKTRPGR